MAVNTKDLILDLVHSDCNSESNIFKSSFFEKHIISVKNIALDLGEHYNADTEVIEIAALLHDIAAIRTPDCLAKHAEDGSKIARIILEKLSFNTSFIDKVELCILNHSKPLLNSNNMELLCVANADVLSKIENFGYWYYFLYSIRKNDYEQVKKWFHSEIFSKYENLDIYSKTIFNTKYNFLYNQFA